VRSDCVGMGEDLRSLRLEDVWELIHHGRRINAGLGLLAEQLDGEYAFLDTADDCKKLARAWKDQAEARAAASISGERVNQLGGCLRRGYAVCCHFSQWAGQVVGTLMSIYTGVQDTDIAWNYCVGLPVMQLFTLYIKCHIQAAHMPLLGQVVRVYLGCLRRVDANDPMGRIVESFIGKTGSLDKLKADISLFRGDLNFRKSFFYGIAPTMLRVLEGSFDWDAYSRTDGDRFFPPGLLTMSHFSDFCESFLCYAWTHLEAVIQDQVQMALFQRICDNIHVFQLYGGQQVDCASLTRAFAKLGELKWEYTPSGRYDPGAVLFTVANRIQQFSHAAAVDLSILCTKAYLAFGLMGLAAFHLENVFRRNYTGGNSDVVHALYWLTRLATQMTNVVPEIRRFVVYNVHEYDAAYLDSLSRSFPIVQTAFDQLQWLAGSLRGVDIEDYDRGSQIDLYPAISYADSVAFRLNKGSTTAGCSHLRPLLELLAGVAWRMRWYQEPFDMIMRFSRLGQFWPYMGTVAEIVGDSSNPAFEENACGMQLCHFYCLDDIAVAEARALPRRAAEHFEMQRKRYSQVINTSLFDKARDAVGSETERVTRLMAVFTALREIGVVQIAGEEKDPFLECWASLTAHVIRNLQKVVESSPPVEFVTVFDRTRSMLQLLGAAGSVGFLSTISTFVQDFSEAGVVGKGFIKRYVDFARGVLKSGVVFSNSRWSFIGPELQQWTSPGALAAASRVFKRQVFVEIVRELLTVIVQNAPGVLESMTKVAKQQKGDLAPPCNLSNAADIVSKIGYMGAILQLRQLLLPYAGMQEDNAVGEALRAVPAVQEFVGDERSADVLAWLMTAPCWDGFSWDSENECAANNPHLWSLFLDSLFPDIEPGKGFYRKFFSSAVPSIRKAGMAKSKTPTRYPGLQLLIVLDQVVRRSRIADWGDLERFAASQLVRVIYANPGFG